MDPSLLALTDYEVGAKRVEDFIKKHEESFSKSVMRAMLVTVLADVMEERKASYEYCRGFISTLNALL